MTKRLVMIFGRPDLMTYFYQRKGDGETTHFMGMAACFFFCYLIYFLFWETVNLNLTFAAFGVNVILNLSNLLFCVEVAKLRDKSLLLSVIHVEVLFVCAWSKANKNYSFCGQGNIYTHPVESHWTFWMGSGFLKTKIF